MAGEGNYFVDYKRGEVMELKNLMRNGKTQRDQTKMREVIKKVVAYMTLGIDVSSLFSEMIMATHTNDMVQRKLVYLYLCTYASEKPDVSLLAVNTLQRDCRDEDPMVRGLALRSLCSLRVANLVEYVLRPIRTCLGDKSGYVRKIAVLGVAKLGEISPETLKSGDMIDVLYNMIQDPDTSVVTNVLYTLDDVLRDEGGMAINDNIVLYLLNRIGSFKTWGQVKVLHVCSRFNPESDEKIFDIMNLLDDRLRQSNSAVVIAAVDVFLKLTRKMPQVQSSVFERIKEPLITHMCSPIPGVAFSILSHIHLLSEKNNGFLSDKYKQFYCRFNDSVENKTLKLKILTNIATRSNATEILNELSEYVTDTNESIGRLSVSCIAEIGIRVSHNMGEAMEHLLSFLNLSNEAIVAEALVSIKDVLRKYPDVENVLPALRDALKTVTEEKAKVAVIFLLGAYGNDISDAPYILENIIDCFEEQPHSAKLELIPASVNLFYKRPGEMKDMLGRLISQASKDESVDVRDRAFFYYSLLQSGVQQAGALAKAEKLPIDSANMVKKGLLNTLIEQLNTLSVVYHKPESQFVRKGDEEEDYFEDSDEEEDYEEEEVEEQAPAAAEISVPTPIVQNTPAAPSAPADDPFGLGALSAAPKPAPAAPAAGGDLFADLFGGSSAPVPSKPKLALTPSPTKPDQATFQSTWQSISNGVLYNSTVKTSMLAQFQKGFQGAGFSVFASGKEGDTAKFFLYCQDTVGMYIFGELQVHIKNGSLKLTLKCPDNAKAEGAKELFADSIKACLDTPLF